VTINASPASLQQGNASSLTWTSSNATACTASGDWTGSRATAGSQSTGTLSSPGTLTYTLTCTGAGGSDSKSAVVTVTASPPPPTLTFEANPTLVSAGGSAVLTWSALNAAGCTASNGWTGSRPTSGSETILGIAATRTFTLACTGAGGTATQDATVTVWTPAPAPTVTLTATPSSVLQGSTSTLVWSSTDATSCSAAGGTWSGTQPAAGSFTTAALNQTTTYTLACTGSGGTATAAATVTVTAAAVAFPLKSPAGTRRLVDGNGRPFLVVGDAPWSLVTGLSKADAIVYLNDRKRLGFNTLVVNIVERFFNGPVNKEGNEPFSKTAGVYDFSKPNLAYFAHVDYVLTEAAKRGMLVLLTPAYLGFGGGPEGWWPQIDTAVNTDTVMLNYGRFLGDRYKSFNNVIWVMGGDWYAPQTLAKTRAIVQGITERDPAKVFTGHNARQQSALDTYAAEMWLTVNTTYSDCASTAARSENDYRNRSRVMPTIYFEGTYENEGGATPECLRSQAYWPVLLGATGSVFGNYPIWSFDPLSFIGPWQQWLDSPGARGMSYFRKLFLSRAWDKLVPSLDGSVLTGGQGALGAGYAAVAVTTGAETVIVYTPTARALTIDMSKVGGTTARAWWFNPDTGAAKQIGDFPTTGTRVFNPPAAQDWVLVIDNASLGLAEPGL
jgi:PKD repeat protein